MRYKQLTGLLGQPNYDDKAKRTVSYDVAIEYGGDTDVEYTKRIMFKLSKDSVVTSYKVEEWHQGD